MFSQFTYQWDDPTELEFDEPVRPYDILHLATSQRVPVYWQSDSVISRDSVYPANQWQPSFLVCKVREEGRNEFEVEGLRGNFLAKVSFEYLLKHNCITWASPLQPRTILQTCPFINESNGAWDSNMSQRYVTEYIRMPSDRDELSDFLEGSLAEDLVNETEINNSREASRFVSTFPLAERVGEINTGEAILAFMKKVTAEQRRYNRVHYGIDDYPRPNVLLLDCEKALASASLAAFVGKSMAFYFVRFSFCFANYTFFPYPVTFPF